MVAIEEVYDFYFIFIDHNYKSIYPAAVSESYDTVLKQKVENIGKRMTSPAMILAQATSPFPITKKSNKSRKKKNNSIPLVSSGPSKTAN